MIETLTIITLSVLFLIFFRPGRTEPLQSPLTINRSGQFNAVLAPMLNLAQPLLENISRSLDEQARQSGDSQTAYYRISDREVKAHGKDYYLLAATLRGGMLYFQAVAPRDDNNDLDTIRAFSETELARHPAASAHTNDAANALTAAIETAVEQRGSSSIRIG